MKKKYLNTLKIIAGALIYTMVITGCGGSGESKSAYSSESYADEAAAGGVYDADYESYEVATESSAPDSVQAEEVTESQSSAKQKRKLITNMSMNTETKEFDKTIDFLKNRTDELDGYVESFSTEKNSYSDERTARMTLRIPEDKLSGFVNEVAKESNITSQEMNVTDVTLTYADLESHRNALRAEEEQLLVLMERANSIKDIMTIQDKLTDVRYQLESMESQLRTYDNQISFSTLKVTVKEVIEYTPEPVKNPSFWERARDGFLDNCDAVGTFFKELALLIITHLPVLLVLAILVIIIIVIIRFADKKRKERLAKRPPVMPVTRPNAGGISPTRTSGTTPIPQAPPTYAQPVNNKKDDEKDDSENS